MKKFNRLALCFLLTLSAASAFSQATSATYASTKVETANVIFMRSTGYAGSAAAFTTFIDDKLVCRLNNKRFSTHTIAAGEHIFSVQFAGKGAKEKAERININAEGGKTYYIQLVFQPGLLVNNIYCQEVTENSAKTMLPKLKEDVKCL
ncbi:MAG TPA: DUF2846 domain-containing protein [Chitinophagaceae bacterium]|nr:DUF2846 domain-containing protein [Chitinophagaceae bacterium]